MSRPRAWGAYLLERLPPASTAAFVFAFTAAHTLLARALAMPVTSPSGPVRFTLALVTVFACFVVLRVADDRKDYDDDRRRHPDRRLQRGDITLTDLERLGRLAVAAALIAGAAAGLPAVVAVGLTLTYTRLLQIGGPVPDTDPRRVAARAAVHALLLPLLSFTVYAFATGEWPWRAPLLFALYVLAGYAATIAWSLLRTMPVPASEALAVARGVLGLWVASIVGFGAVAVHARLGLGLIVGLTVLLAVGGVSYTRSSKDAGSARAMAVVATLLPTAVHALFALALALRASAGDGGTP